MENLGRGVVAVRASATDVFVSWRLLGYEPQDLGFNVYRSANGGLAEKLNDAPLTAGTNFTDTTANPSLANAYFVRPVINGTELGASAAYTLAANAPVRPFLSLPLQPTPSPTYVHLVWVGDLDGDGEYDFVVSRMPLEAGRSQLLDAYKRDGSFLWRIDFGPLSVDPDNIEPPAAAINAGHNDGVTVYDLDSDGRAEVVIKSAHGVVFGNGQTLTHGDNVSQFISVLDGLTGAERARAPVPNDYIADGPVAGHFGIAYLDGVKPSFVFKAKNRVGSGPFNVFVTTWDFDGTNLTQRWKFAPGIDNAYPNFHQIRIVDVDRDGRDEICDGGYVLDDDGTVLYSLAGQGVVHGDRFHIGDLDPDRPGLEGFGIQQNNASGLLYYVYDAATGAMIHRHFGGVEDTARGTAADVSGAHRGYEYWSFHGIHEIKGGSLISPDPKRPWPNFRIWWDGDVLSENLNREIVEKWDPATGGTVRLLTASEDGAVDSWRDAAQFYGDILGDWREEVVYEKTDHTALLIFTTPVPTPTRLYTLPHNPEYRLCFTVKGYLQSNMLDYYLGGGMTPPPPPAIIPVLRADAATPVITSFADDTGGAPSDRITSDTTPVLGGQAAPGAQVVIGRVGVGDDGVATADAAGNWSFSYSTPLPDGLHYFVARVNEPGSRSSFAFGAQIDTAAPVSPAVEAVLSDGAGGLIVSGTASAGLRVDLAIEGIGPIGSAVVDESGRWIVNYAGVALPTTSYSLTAAAVDVAGNVSLPTYRVVDPATASPLITAVMDDTGVSSSDRITSDRTLVLVGTAAPGASVTLYQLGTGPLGTVTADASGQWSFDRAASLVDGEYSFTAYSGESIGAPGFVVTIDGAAPAISAVDRISPTAASSSATSVTFRVTFTEATTGVDASDFTAVFGGGLTGMISAVIGAGESAYDVTLSALQGEGTVRLDVNASGTGIADVAGNLLAGGYAAGDVFTRVLLGDGMWIRTASGGLWSQNENWLGGIVADGAGKTADFSTLELPEDVIVQLDSPRSLTNLVFGDEDTTSAASWTVANNGGATNILTLVSGSSGPGITVNELGTGARANLAVTLAGTNGFTKRGPGTLALSAQNELSGTVTVSEGDLRVEAGARLAPGSVSVSGSRRTFTVAGGLVEATGNANLSGAGAVVVEAGQATFAAISGSNNTGNAVRVNGGKLVTGSISFQRSTDGSLNYNTGLIVRGGEVEVGAINLGTANSNAMMSVEGGLVTASGTVSLGNQSSGGRGGHLRVTGGVLAITDTAEAGGLLISRRNNNTSTANFLGGISTIERISFGVSGQSSGRGTLTLDGGLLYVGAGGMVKPAGGSFEAVVNLASGTLGADSTWTSSLNMNLAGLVEISTADVEENAHQITLDGVLSGTGGFTKTGAGNLVLNAANTFGGDVVVSGGTLRVNGSLSAGGTLQVNAGGVLAGSGSVAKPVVLNADGLVSPDGTGPVATLTADSLIWHGGGALALDLGENGVSDRLVLGGTLQKGTSGAYRLLLNPTAALAPGNMFTLASFASTDFNPNDFTVEGLPVGLGARVVMAGVELRVMVVARPVITGAASAMGTFDAPFSYQIVAENGPTEYSAVGLPPGLVFDPTSGLISGRPGASGVFVVTIGAGNEGGSATAQLTLTIAKASAPVVIGTAADQPVRRFYTGSAIAAPATTIPAGLPIVFTYNGEPAAPVLPGTYSVAASIDDPNYQGTATGTLVIQTTVLVRHAPTLNGDIDGSVQVIEAENVTLNGGVMVASDLLVRGTPRLQTNGTPVFAGVQDATGAADPASHVVTLNGGAVLRYLVRRVDPVSLPTLTAPAKPAGTRLVTITRAGDSAGDFGTVRNLTLNGNVGPVAVPPGVYGTFIANGNNAFVLGVPGSTEPTVYEFQQLTLNGAKLQLAGPVLIKVAGQVATNGSMGSQENPRWLTLQLPSAGLILNGTATLYGEVIAPRGTVTINGAAKLHGNVIADRLVLNGAAAVIEP